MASNEFACDEFPRGPGIAQGPGIADAFPTDLAAGPSMARARPGMTADAERPQPTDPAGTNNSGWIKTAGYQAGDYQADSVDADGRKRFWQT
jgi:hypothetical protein